MANRGDSKNEDRQLFREAMHDATPIQQEKVSPYKKRLRPKPLEQEQEPEREFTEHVADRDIETGDELLFSKPGLQKRVFQDLRRGHIQPEASIDLHGLRVREARPVLADFLQSCWDRRFRCVRIIHGKSRGSDGRQPVLKQKVNQWLPQWGEVLAYCSAPRWDGGTGATYVLLRRKKPEPWD